MNELFENFNILEVKDESLSAMVHAKQSSIHRNPFEFMKIDDNRFLEKVDGRSPCKKCGKSRKFFCYTCHVAVCELEERLPKVKLPVKIDIIKHPREIDGKSTAVHAAVLASEDVKIYTYPDIPDYSIDSDKTVRTLSRI